MKSSHSPTPHCLYQQWLLCTELRKGGFIESLNDSQAARQYTLRPSCHTIPMSPFIVARKLPARTRAVACQACSARWRQDCSRSAIRLYCDCFQSTILSEVELRWQDKVPSTLSSIRVRLSHKALLQQQSVYVVISHNVSFTKTAYESCQTYEVI